MTGKRKAWRTWLFLLVLLLGFSAWRWVTAPPTMRLAGKIPVGNITRILPTDGMLTTELGLWGGLYMRRDAAGMTFIGWDGKPRWSIRAVIPAKVECGSLIYQASGPQAMFSLSPDGHVCALATLHGYTAQVQSWRDGRPLGQATVSLLKIQYREYGLLATNSGRVWLYNQGGNMQPGSTYEIWAFDGNRVAFGRYTPSSPITIVGSRPSQLSPEGQRLLCEDGGSSLDYVDLTVAGNAVKAVKRYTLKTTQYEGWSWLDDERAWTYDRVIGPKGVLATVPDNGLSVYPRDGKPWQVPVANYYEFQSAVDGHTALVVDATKGSGIPQALYLLIEKLPTAWLNGLSSNQLDIYTAPGRLRARLIINTGIRDSVHAALSPDGRQVAVLTRRQGQYAIELYRWK